MKVTFPLPSRIIIGTIRILPFCQTFAFKLLTVEICLRFSFENCLSVLIGCHMLKIVVNVAGNLWQTLHTNSQTVRGQLSPHNENLQQQRNKQYII